MSTQELALRPNGGAIASTRQEFGATELQRANETAAQAVAAREQAAIQARYIMAERHPRDLEDFRVRLEKECRRPSFAKVAIYKKPVGKKLDQATGRWIDDFKEGPSIRFIETALQCFRNVYPEVVTVFDSAEVRICRVSVTDLEANLTYTTEVSIAKQVERKGKKVRKDQWDPPEGRIVLGERLNSYGDKTYLVVATDDEVQIKQNALLSKAIRTNGQRLLPGDIVENCQAIIRETRRKEDAKDPDAAKRALIDAFAQLGVSPGDLQGYLGHSLDSMQPAEIEDLRGIFVAVRDGEATWGSVMEARSSAESGSQEAQQDIAAKKLEELQKQQSASKAPDKITEEQQQQFLDMVAEWQIPQADAQQIIEQRGFKKPFLITVDVWPKIIEDLKAYAAHAAASNQGEKPEAASAGTEQPKPAATTAERPQFGRRPR